MASAWSPSGLSRRMRAIEVQHVVLARLDRGDPRPGGPSRPRDPAPAPPPARTAARASAAERPRSGLRVEEQVAQVEPGLDVVGVGAGDGVVERLRLSDRAVEPGSLGAQDQVIVGREAGAVLVASVGELAGEVGQGAAGGGGRQPVVRQREGGIGVHRRLEALHRVEVAPGPQLSLPLEVGPQRVERAGGQRGDPCPAGFPARSSGRRAADGRSRPPARTGRPRSRPRRGRRPRRLRRDGRAMPWPAASRRPPPRSRAGSGPPRNAPRPIASAAGPAASAALEPAAGEESEAARGGRPLGWRRRRPAWWPAGPPCLPPGRRTAGRRAPRTAAPRWCRAELVSPAPARARMLSASARVSGVGSSSRSWAILRAKSRRPGSRRAGRRPGPAGPAAAAAPTRRRASAPAPAGPIAPRRQARPSRSARSMSERRGSGGLAAQPVPLPGRASPGTRLPRPRRGVRPGTTRDRASSPARHRRPGAPAPARSRRTRAPLPAPRPPRPPGRRAPRPESRSGGNAATGGARPGHGPRRGRARRERAGSRAGESGGGVGGEIGEEPEPLGLLEHGAHLLAVSGPEVQHAEGVQLDHGRLER